MSDSIGIVTLKDMLAYHEQESRDLAVKLQGWVDAQLKGDQDARPHIEALNKACERQKAFVNNLKFFVIPTLERK